MAQLAVGLQGIDYARLLEAPILREVRERTHDDKIEIGAVEKVLYIIAQTYRDLPRKYQEMLENPRTITRKNFEPLAANAMDVGSKKQYDAIYTGTSHFSRYWQQ